MPIKNFFLILILTLVYGCSTTEDFFDDITAPDYVNSSKSKKLEVPPDLSELETNSSFDVPGDVKSYKDYKQREQDLADNYLNPNRKKIVENPEGMKIIKSGNLRWLVVEKEPEKIWPHVKDFWEDLGFRVNIANKRTGIIETEWMDTDDIKLDKNDGVISTFDKWLDSLSGFADKRKFRTRVEIGEQGTTEIYISQRSAEAAADQHSRILRERNADYNVGTINKIEEYKSDDQPNTKKVEVSEQREIDDYEIDSELLTRLMIKLGSTDFDAKQKVLNPEVIVKAELINNQDDLYIRMFDQYDRAWRRLGLALDIIGFVTEDKNRSEGIYYVRFSQIDLPSEKKEEEDGLLDSLIFWGNDEKLEKEDQENTESIVDDIESGDEDIDSNSTEPSFTGIEAPEIKPIDEDYVADEFGSDHNAQKDEEETWVSKLWPSWGDEDKDDILPTNEKRYRIRIKPDNDGTSIVFIDFSNGKKSKSSDSRKVLKIINEYLK